LNDDPAADRVSNNNFVNISPLQFVEEIAPIHVHQRICQIRSDDDRSKRGGNFPHVSFRIAPRRYLDKFYFSVIEGNYMWKILASKVLSSLQT